MYKVAKVNKDRYAALGKIEPYIAVDLDGTLAEYHGWAGVTDIGAPIPAMVNRVKYWLSIDQKVKIFTARVDNSNEEELALTVLVIQQWCQKHIGVLLPITNVKDFAMLQLWDDRCVQVILNTGKTLSDVLIEAETVHELPKPQ